MAFRVGDPVFVRAWAGTKASDYRRGAEDTLLIPFDAYADGDDLFSTIDAPAPAPQRNPRRTDE